MAYTTIDDPTIYFNTKLYTGNATDNTGITGVGFQPDWTWLKDRTNANHHRIYDSVRGATKVIYSSLTNAEGTASTGLKSFDSDGFTLGTGSDENGSGANFVSWNWKAGGTASSNTDGSITSSVSANQTAGFSILTRNGTGSNGTVGHGLGVAPKMIINKDRNSGSSWWGVFHESLGNTNAIYLNTTNATDASVQYWNNTSPTSSVFSVGTNSISNASGGSYISYCFAEIKGYSKFGSYTGNANADGTFIYTGFKPAFIMLKPTSTTGNWFILDNKRNPFNVVDQYIRANLTNADATFSMMDFVSNGIKIITSDSSINGSGVTYIYMAFAENPFVSSAGIPCTAR